MEPRSAGVVFLLLLAGCSVPQDAPGPIDFGEQTPCPPDSQTFLATVGGHYLHTPLGDTGGGNYRDFTWGRDPETLLRVVIEARWNATDAAGQELSMRANLLEGVDYFDQPMVEGPSALIIDIDLAASEARDEPRVYFESPHRTWLPASASKTLLQQNVTVSTLEYYTCDAQA